jgi:hypothetical protein
MAIADVESSPATARNDRDLKEGNMVRILLGRGAADDDRGISSIR